MKTTYKIIKRNYGVEFNNYNSKNYSSKQEAINAGNSWISDSVLNSEIKKGWNFEVVEA